MAKTMSEALLDDLHAQVARIRSAPPVMGNPQDLADFLYRNPQHAFAWVFGHWDHPDLLPALKLLKERAQARGSGV